MTRFPYFQSIPLVMAALVVSPARAQQVPAPTVIRSLDDALQIARERAPVLRQARETYTRKQKTVQQILAVSKPQISLRGSYSRLFNGGSGFGGASLGSAGSLQSPFPVLLQSTPPGSQPLTLPTATRAEETDTTGTTGTTTTTGNTFGSGTDLNQTSVSLSISQGLDLAGVLRIARAIGDIELEIQTLELQRLEQEVALTTRTNYYNLLRSDAVVRVNEAAVAQSTEQLRVAESQFRAGTVAQFEVLRARTQLSNNQQTLISTRNQLVISKNAFATAIGADPATPIELSAPTETKEKEPLPALDEAALIAEARTKRPEAQQAERSLQKAEKNVQLYGRGLAPSLSAGLSTSYNPKPAFVGDRATGALGLTLNVPLSDGGASRAQTEAARSDQRAAEIQKDQYLRGIQAEVQQAIVAVRDAHERADTAWQAVEQAREAYRIALVRFREGVDTQLSVNDAQTSLTQAETNIINARYDYLTALARLARATGKG